MAFTLIQTGGSLKSVNTDGTLGPALTLPSNIDLATNRQPRFARFKRYAILVNTPTKPLSIDPDGVVRILTPDAPTAAVTLSDGAAGSLSGTYLSLQTYYINDLDGNLISESGAGPAMSAAYTIASKKLRGTFAVSGESVTGSKIYRTTTNGSTYFPWTSTTDNIDTTVENDTSDAALGLVEMADLGEAPDLTLIAEWQGRLWGVDRTEIDDLRYTESGTMYGWSALNTLPIGKIGTDQAGVIALVARRNALGVARKNSFLQITGTTRSNIGAKTLHEELGVLSQESVVVFNDVAFFLWRDGVYTWDDSGFKCISNGKVRSWFTTDTYFNRTMFWRAFAGLDPLALRYRLYLASADSTTIDRWVEYDIPTGTWWGPHRTDALSPTCAISVYEANMQPSIMVGSSGGFLSKDQETRTDWTSAISLSARTKNYFGDDPEKEKYFGEPTILIDPLTSGNLTVTPYVGKRNAPARTASTYSMTNARKCLGRMGTGQFGSLKFTNSEVGKDVVLVGYAIDPIHIIGKR